MRSISSGFLNTLLPFLLVLLDCTPPFLLFLSSSFLFDYLPSAYLFSAQLWNISGIIIFPFVITLVSRSDPHHHTHDLGRFLGYSLILCNIWPYPHCSKHTLLLPNAFSLFRPWLPNAGTRGHCNIYNVDYSPQEPHLILWGISWSSTLVALTAELDLITRALGILSEQLLSGRPPLTNSSPLSALLQERCHFL